MSSIATIENGFAGVEAGDWLMSQSQPAAFTGTVVHRKLRGWSVPDRAYCEIVTVGGMARCADATRPFLTHIPCAAPVSAISSKVLLAPAAARKGAYTLKPVPMNFRSAFSVTEFAQMGEVAEHPGGQQEPGTPDRRQDGYSWVVMATVSRTTRWTLAEDETISVRPESIVAWTGKRPTGFCPKLRLRDIILPRLPGNLLFTFYGPGVVWIEGSRKPQDSRGRGCWPVAGRGVYGI